MQVRVRARRNVLGLRTGEIAWVDATPAVETLVRVGFLKWLDEPTDYALPEMYSASFDDEPLPPLPDIAYLSWDSVDLDAWLDDGGLSVLDDES